MDMLTVFENKSSCLLPLVRAAGVVFPGKMPMLDSSSFCLPLVRAAGASPPEQMPIPDFRTWVLETNKHI